MELFRIDAIPKIKLDWERVSHGLRAFGGVGKADLPLEYLYWDSKKSGLRSQIETIEKEELFNEDSLKSLWGLPIILGHPKKQYFNNNEEGLLIGSCLQEFIRADDGTLLVQMEVHDRRGIELINREIERGMQAELSPAYRLRDVKLREDNVYLQLGRLYDHIALLASGNGRAGDEVTFRTDGKDLRKYFLGSNLISKTLVEEGKKKMANLVIRGANDSKGDRVFTDVDEELAGAVTGLQVRLDALDKELLQERKKANDLQANADRLSGELEAQKIKNTELENTRLDASALNSEIQERLDAWDIVEGELRAIAKKSNKEFRRDNKLSATEIKRLYIKEKSPKTNLEGVSEQYINGLFEGLKPRELSRMDDNEIITRTDNAFSILNSGIENEDDDTLRSDARNAREERRKRIEKNGKTTAK